MCVGGVCACVGHVWLSLRCAGGLAVEGWWLVVGGWWLVVIVCSRLLLWGTAGSPLERTAQHTTAQRGRQRYPSNPADPWGGSC